jgi:tetratricopeptide (TPR) repeat protein
MIKRDYILRMIEEFAAALNRIRKRIDEEDYPVAGEELDKTFLDLMGMGADAVSRLSETELLARLTMEGPTHMVREKASLVVALLQKAGEIHAAAGRDAQCNACWTKALNLLLMLQLEEVVFEPPEFVPKIDHLRDELAGVTLPLQTLAGLWRHYERIGSYGRAEDALGELLEAEPDNAALRVEAKAFYRRLLEQSDSSLNEGNLPRAEAEAGLAGLGD